MLKILKLLSLNQERKNMKVLLNLNLIAKDFCSNNDKYHGIKIDQNLNGKHVNDFDNQIN